jgi:type 1 fimbriae regulatory protein FimB
MKALTPQEVMKVLKAASESKRNSAIILLAFQHGMRISEICNLKMCDLDMKNYQVTVRRLKSSLTTTQPLQDMLGQPLLSERKVMRAWLAERRDPSEYVFTSQKGGRLDRSAIHRMFADVAERAGMAADKRHFHCLKHSLGFALVASNVNLAAVRIALGHKNISSTAIYAVPTSEQVGKVVHTALAGLF